MSVVVVCNALLMASVAILCTLVSCHVILTDPVFHFVPGCFVEGYTIFRLHKSFWVLLLLCRVVACGWGIAQCQFLLGNGIVEPT